MEQYLTLMENCCEILKEIKTVTWAINDPGMSSLKNAYDDIADYQNHINNVYAWHNLDKVDEMFYTSDQLYYHEQLQEAQKNLNWAKEILDALTHQEHERFSPVLETSVLVCKKGGVVSITENTQSDYMRSLVADMKGRFLPDKNYYGYYSTNGTVLLQGAKGELVNNLHTVLRGLAETGKIAQPEGFHIDYTTMEFGEPTVSMINQYINNGIPVIPGFESKLSIKKTSTQKEVDTNVWESLGLPVGSTLEDFFIISKPTKKDYFLHIELSADDVHIYFKPKIKVYQAIDTIEFGYVEIELKPGHSDWDDYVDKVLTGLKGWESLVNTVFPIKIHGRIPTVTLHLIDKNGNEYLGTANLADFCASWNDCNLKIHRDYPMTSMAMKSVIWSRNAQVKIDMGDTFTSGANPTKGIYYSKSTGIYTSTPNLAHLGNVAKHEFGHVMGLWDAYSYDSHWSWFPIIGEPFGDWLVRDATSVTKTRDTVMYNNTNVSALEIEMILWAWQRDKLQTYCGGALGEVTGEITQALFHSNGYV